MGKDMVNSPAHYNQTELECIDAIKYALGEEGFVAYCRGNAIKYNWRAGHKIDSVEDLNKAAWYCRMAAGDDPRKDAGYTKGADAREEARLRQIEFEQELTGPCKTDEQLQREFDNLSHLDVQELEHIEVDEAPTARQKRYFAYKASSSIVPPECDNRGGA